MAMTYAQYINYVAGKLKNYINYLVDFNNEYNEKLKEMHKNYQSDVIHKSDEMIQLEKEIKEAYDNATSLYNDLLRIADKYKSRMNIDSDLQWFQSRFNSTKLPIYENVTLNAVQTIKLKPIDNSKEGVITGGASYIKNVQDMYTRNINHEKEFEKKYENLAKQKLAEILIGDNYSPDFYDHAKHKYGPDTAGMLDLAHEKRNDTSYEKDAIKLTNWNDPRVASDKDYLRKKVMEQFSYYDFDEDNVPGYFFKSNSEPSKRIASNPDFLKTIKENKKDILNNKNGISMGFPNYGHNTKSNLHFALGHVDIRNGYLDKNGNLHVKVYDTYDFNPGEDSPLIIAGKNKMLDVELKPFFTIHDIIIQKEKLKELWK